MKYALCILSHGPYEAQGAAESFGRHVCPPPIEVIHHHDEVSAGFCGATKSLWQKASKAESDFIFWLEHDFRFMCDIDLRDLAAVLVSKPKLAQMALIRTAVNERERAAGGVYEMHPPSDYQPHCDEDSYWLEHRINFTTNPSLMRRQMMVDNPWPDYSSECEGKFSADFLKRGYFFAYWGQGEPWVEHVGPMRTGHSY